MAGGKGPTIRPKSTPAGLAADVLRLSLIGAPGEAVVITFAEGVASHAGVGGEGSSAAAMVSSRACSLGKTGNATLALPSGTCTPF